jgi:protein-tyrosine phosphatase
VIDTIGHGRSACVVCAILVALGVAETWKDAENIIRERRKIKMNALHRKTLEEWSKHRVSQKKGN